jgi:hypothetical protein
VIRPSRPRSRRAVSTAATSGSGSPRGSPT